MRRWLPLLVATFAVAAGGVALAGCGDSGPSPLLRALRDDPMARFDPPGAKLADSSQQDQGGSLGKGFEVRVERSFTVPTDAAEDAFDSAQQAARESGWRFRDESVQAGTNTSAVGERTVLQDRAATLTIVLERGGNATSAAPSTLQILVASGNQVVSPR